MKAIKKIFIPLLVLLFLVEIYFKVKGPSSLSDFPELMVNLHAREYCSCVFVEGLDPDQCREEIYKVIRLESLEVDREQKRVKASFLWKEAYANYRGERLGCR
jgi:hypothetical protein